MIVLVFKLHNIMHLNSYREALLPR